MILTISITVDGMDLPIDEVDVEVDDEIIISYLEAEGFTVTEDGV